MTRIYVLSGLVGIFFTQASLSQVVIEGSVELHAPGSFGSDIQLTVYQDPDLTNPTSLFFDFRYDLFIGDEPGGEVTFDRKLTLNNISVNADEGSDWWISPAGSVVDATGAEGVFLGLDGVTLDSEDMLLSPSSSTTPSFLLAFRTVEQGGFLPRTIFGWAELQLPLSQGSLVSPTIVRSATAFASGGIVVGGISTVPESAAVVPLASALVAAVSGNCRSFRKSHP